MKNIIFYSKSKVDQHSPRLFEIMKRMPMQVQSEFIYYCIDPDPVSKKRNDDVLQLLGVSEVPTMYLQGEKYVGKDAFDCLLMLFNQMQAGAGGGAPGVQPGGMYDEPYPPQYRPQGGGGMMEMPYPGGGMGMPPGMAGMQPGMPPQMGGRMPPGMGGMPPGMGGMQPGMGGMGGGMSPMIPGNQEAGSGGPRGGLYGGSGGGADSAYADPFAPTDITGINQCGLTPEQILTPIQTKNQDTSARSDEMLKKYAMERDAMFPQSQAPQTIPGMNMSMAQMALPPMQMQQMQQMRRWFMWSIFVDIVMLPSNTKITKLLIFF